MRKKLVIGNWKMNLYKRECKELVNEVIESNLINDVEIVFAPPFVYLDLVSLMCLDKENFNAAAQNCSSSDNGAFTGEVSAKMIGSLNAKYIILGHSERRQNFNESEQILNSKIVQALKYNTNIVFCCGEDITQRESCKHFDIIEQQISSTIFKLELKDFKNIIIAYEPIWAIGTGKTASADQAQEMHHFIRSLIEKKYNNHISSVTPILYGGSCKPINSKELFAKPDIDGGLIGGASLNAKDFLSIVKSF